MKKKKEIILYLPTNLISSEKLLLLLTYESKKSIKIKFQKNFIKKKNKNNKEEKEEKNFSKNNSFSSLEIYSISSKKSVTSYDSNSSLNFKKKKTEFTKNEQLTKKLNFSKIKKKKKLIFPQNSFKPLSTEPSLSISKQYFYGFDEILDILLRIKKFKINTLLQNKIKLQNYIFFIENNIDIYVIPILEILYEKNIYKKKIDYFLKKLIKKLKYFEDYLLIENFYLISDEVSIVDIFLLGSLINIFKFFFNKKIRDIGFPNLTRWFKRLVRSENYIKNFGKFKFCQVSFLYLFEKKINTDNSNLNLHNNDFLQMKKLKIILNQNLQNLEEIPSKNFNHFFFAFNFSKYSLWFFEFINDEDQSIDLDNSYEHTNDEIFKFFIDTKNNFNKKNDKFNLLLYLAIYSDKDISEEKNFGQDFDFENISLDYFNRKKIKGFLFIKNLELIKELREYEEIDLIHVIQQDSRSIKTVINDILVRKDFFSMRNIYKEIII